MREEERERERERERDHHSYNNLVLPISKISVYSFISSNDFNSAPGSEWIIGTCVKSPCVAAGNNELTSVYR